MTPSRGLNAGWILPPVLAIVLVSTLLGLLSSTQDGALANGAARAVVKNRLVGPYELQVGILPGNPKVGNLHLSILVKDAESKAVITTGKVTVTGRGPEGATNVGPVEAVHTLESPQFYDVNITLDMVGRWVLDLRVESSLGEESLEVPLEVTEGGGISLALIAAVAIALLTLAVWIWGRMSIRRRRRRQRA